MPWKFFTLHSRNYLLHYLSYFYNFILNQFEYWLLIAINCKVKHIPLLPLLDKIGAYYQFTIYYILTHLHVMHANIFQTSSWYSYTERASSLYLKTRYFFYYVIMPFLQSIYLIIYLQLMQCDSCFHMCILFCY